MQSKILSCFLQNKTMVKISKNTHGKILSFISHFKFFVKKKNKINNELDDKSFQKCGTHCPFISASTYCTWGRNGKIEHSVD